MKKPFLPFFCKLLAVICILAGLTVACTQRQEKQTRQTTSPSRQLSDEGLLDTLERLHFNYFWELAHTQTGLIPDRAPTETFASIAAVGFGLTGYLVGAERGYVSRQQAAERVLKTLLFLWKAPQGPNASGIAGHKGFFYHFLNPATGHRYQQVELSTIDTALLIAGVLSCQSYFDGPNSQETQIRQYADSLYRRIDWRYFLQKDGVLSMGWHPEKGFIPSYWYGYNEAMILYFLALGSSTFPITPQCWNTWTKDYQWVKFQGYEHVNFGPLFGHQYSHLWVDFRKIQDAYMRAKGIDYFENSRRATLSQRAYCEKNPGGFKGYSGQLWGLTACDGPKDTTLQINGKQVQFHSYWARGVAEGYTNDDGTLAPSAAGGSLPFAPEVCLPVLREMYQRYGGRLVGEYGFKDAFNLTYPAAGDSMWVDKDYLGIDQGPILIQIENHRTGFVWELMKKNQYITKGIQRAGFQGGWLEKQSQ